MHSLIILDILRLLWLNHHTEVQVVLLTDESHHHLYIMIVIAILRETALIIILVIFEMTGKRIQIAVPTTVLLITTHRILAEIVGAAVALGVAVSKLIAELQEGSLPEWLTIGQLSRITVILRRSQVVAVGLISRILTLCRLYEIEMCIRDRATSTS